MNAAENDRRIKELIADLRAQIEVAPRTDLCERVMEIIRQRKDGTEPTKIA